MVEAWASALDRDTFRVRHTDDGGFVVEQVPSERVIERLARSNSESGRALAGFGFMAPYRERYEHRPAEPVGDRDRLVADLATAQDLLDDPPEGGLGRPFDAPAMVAAAALEAHLRDGVDLPQDDLVWAASVLVALPIALAETGASEHPGSAYSFGLDCSAGRGLPLLMLPCAGDLKNALAAEEMDAQAIAAAVSWVVSHGTNLARLFLARALDRVWETPCDVSSGPCHHQRAFAIVEDLARDCLIVEARGSRSGGRRGRLEGAVTSQLNAQPEAIVDVERLSPVLRASGAAAASSACCREVAKGLALAALTAHRRGMGDHDGGYFHFTSEVAVAARATLDIASAGDDSTLFGHIEELAADARLLGQFLNALSVTGEENDRRAAAAREVWPAVMNRVATLVEALVEEEGGELERDWRVALAAAIPRPSHERQGWEFEGEPVPWAHPAALVPQVERWIPLAAGHSEAVDAVARLLARLPADQQAQLGLPWMERLVLEDPRAIARGSWRLPDWLQGVQAHATSAPLAEQWHRIVDALIVAGDTRVAALAD
jgi:hypothetical protein